MDSEVANDFVISRSQGQWQAVAASDRGKALAAGDPRFDGGRAALDPAEALAIYRELHERGYFAGVPDGLPPPGRGLLFSRFALLLALIVIPIMLFVLLA